MKKQLKHITHENLFYGFIAIGIVSVIFSRFMLSVSMFALVFLSFFHVHRLFPFEISWRDDLRVRLRQLVYSPEMWLVCLYFFLVLLSGIWSEEISYWGDEIRKALPFLLFPFLFISHSRINAKKYLYLHLLMLLCCLVASSWVLLNYSLDFSSITESIKKGQAIPTPISRPHFSMLIAFGFMVSVMLNLDPTILMRRKYRWLLTASSIFLFVFLHILSVRTGLLIAYPGLIFLWMWKGYQSKRYMHGIILLLLLLIIPLLSYCFIPSFQNKVDYSIYDLKQFTKAEGANYSDSERLYSIKVGWHVFKDHPVLGSGIGDLRPDCMQYYRAEDIQLTHFKYPHNQFIYILAAYGIIGLMVFLLALYGPLCFGKNYQNLYLVLLYLSITGLFLVESPLGRSNMVGFFLLFLMMGLRVKQMKQELKLFP